MTGEVATGQPAEVLIDASRHAELVVVSQRSQDPEVLLNASGSTSVVAASATFSPMVVVRGASDPARRHTSPVVVGATGKPETDAALAFAATTAQRWDVP